MNVPPATGGCYPRRAGNAVEPLVDGVAAFGRIAEAADSAEHSLFVTVAFLDDRFRFPDGRSLFDLLDATAARKVDVRVLFWRSPELEAFLPGTHFIGSAEHHEMLRARAGGWQARWDRVPKGGCHHQKSWLVNAGHATETAFVGGINLDVHSVVEAGHPFEAAGVHDVYLQVRGPCATDVHHNFVQRWNGASERTAEGGFFPREGTADLPFPAALSAEPGDVPVQITRSVQPNLYAGATASPGGATRDIVNGERSVFEQYLLAIDAAERTIYIEDQAIGSAAVLERLVQALGRGVRVVYLAPCEPAVFTPPALDALPPLARQEAFALVGISASTDDGRLRDIYVHAKIAIVDDSWFTVGSCNISDRSFDVDTEMNASCWHPETARALRVSLFAEHLGRDTADLDDVAALRLYAEVARDNALRRTKGERLLGLARSLDIASYRR